MPPISWRASLLMAGIRWVRGRFEWVIGAITAGRDDPHRLIDRDSCDALRAIDPAIAGECHPLFEQELLQVVMRDSLQRWRGKPVLGRLPERPGRAGLQIEEEHGHGEGDEAQEA